jgi:hypothetical protein
MPPLAEASLGAEGEAIAGPGTPSLEVSQDGSPSDASACWEEK